MIADFVISHGSLIAPLLIVLMFLESAPFTGFFIPGSFLLPLVGAIAGTTHSSLGVLLVFAVSGSCLGDLLGFYLGKKGAGKLVQARFYKGHQNAILKAQEELNRHGVLAVFIGRFVWLIHPAIPAMAGLSGVKSYIFMLVDLLAAFLWVGVYLGAGYLLTGFRAEETLEFIEIIGIVLTVSLVLWLLRFFISKQHQPVNTDKKG